MFFIQKKVGYMTIIKKESETDLEEIKKPVSENNQSIEEFSEEIAPIPFDSAKDNKAYYDMFVEQHGSNRELIDKIKELKENITTRNNLLAASDKENEDQRKKIKDLEAFRANVRKQEAQQEFKQFQDDLKGVLKFASAEDIQMLKGINAKFLQKNLEEYFSEFDFAINII